MSMVIEYISKTETIIMYVCIYVLYMYIGIYYSELRRTTIYYSIL